MKKHRILIVDDEQIIANILARVLSESYIVSVCYGGLEALKLLRDAHSEKTFFNLILLDYLMPEFNGKVVLEWIKKNEPRSKIILMTAYGDAAVKKELEQAGADLILTKPFDDINQIHKIIEKII